MQMVATSEPPTPVLTELEEFEPTVASDELLPEHHEPLRVRHRMKERAERREQQAFCSPLLPENGGELLQPRHWKRAQERELRAANIATKHYPTESPFTGS